MNLKLPVRAGEQLLRSILTQQQLMSDRIAAELDQVTNPANSTTTNCSVDVLIQSCSSSTASRTRKL